MRILAADVSKAMRIITVRELRRIGYDDDVLEAGTAASALEQALALEVDLVLCDKELPDMSGLELLERLRSSGWLGVFGFVTTEHDEASYQRAIAAGASFVVTKPFAADLVVAEIDRALGTTMQRPAGGRPAASRRARRAGS